LEVVDAELSNFNIDEEVLFEKLHSVVHLHRLRDEGFLELKAVVVVAFGEAVLVLERAHKVADVWLHVEHDVGLVFVHDLKKCEVRIRDKLARRWKFYTLEHGLNGRVKEARKEEFVGSEERQEEIPAASALRSEEQRQLQTRLVVNGFDGRLQDLAFFGSRFADADRVFLLIVPVIVKLDVLSGHRRPRLLPRRASVRLQYFLRAAVHPHRKHKNSIHTCCRQHHILLRNLPKQSFACCEIPFHLSGSKKGNLKFLPRMHNI
jgi:hypothetical protein